MTSAHKLRSLRSSVSPLVRPASGWSASSTQSTTARGYGHAWRQLRDRIMARDCGMCQPCRMAGRVTAASAVDHIVNKARGGTDSEANLQAICDACHKAKTAAERTHP